MLKLPASPGQGMCQKLTDDLTIESDHTNSESGPMKDASRGHIYRGPLVRPDVPPPLDCETGMCGFSNCGSEMEHKIEVIRTHVNEAHACLKISGLTVGGLIVRVTSVDQSSSLVVWGGMLCRSTLSCSRKCVPTAQRVTGKTCYPDTYVFVPLDVERVLTCDSVQYNFT